MFSNCENTPFFLQQGSIYAIGILHYNMEMAAEVRRLFLSLKPDCVAVELPEPLQLQCLHAASRLPDISVIHCEGSLYYLAEPCDGAFEGLRSALEAGIPGFCIDYFTTNYPEIQERFPDPYAVTRIGYESYYKAYEELKRKHTAEIPLDLRRELHMAKRLKELSLRYDKVLFITGMAHVKKVLEWTQLESF